MKAFLFILISTFISTSNVFAQCETCQSKQSLQADFCFTDSLFTNYCAQFSEKATTFRLISGKKEKDVPYQDNTDTPYLLSLAQNKKLKLGASEMLFIQEALKVWNVEKRKIGFEMAESGLGIKIIKEGNGTLPEQGKMVKVHYSGFLEDGTKFDSSVDRGEPFQFPLGTGRVIKGWDEGVSKLSYGTKALLMIPSDLAYGPRGAGGVIPPDATLIFEIEVIGPGD